MGINIQIKDVVFLRSSSATTIQSKNLASFSLVTEGEDIRAKLVQWSSQFSINQATSSIFPVCHCQWEAEGACRSTRFLAFCGKDSILKENRIIIKQNQNTLYS